MVVEVATRPKLMDLPTVVGPAHLPAPRVFSARVLLRQLSSVSNIPGLREGIATEAIHIATTNGWRPRYYAHEPQSTLNAKDLGDMVCARGEQDWAAYFYKGKGFNNQRSLQEMFQDGNVPGVYTQIDWDMSPDGRGTIVEYSLAFLAAVIPEAKEPLTEFISSDQFKVRD